MSPTIGVDADKLFLISLISKISAFVQIVMLNIYFVCIFVCSFLKHGMFSLYLLLISRGVTLEYTCKCLVKWCLL
ncbi:hypothetical protein VIGAN_10232400 [Vigna angularis var. angularis]|uniref:Uncharacterized protein n=1 Tax=Vigna angularis var. angularis TaxID=157739 RepID=A0A0S3T6I5_PHAAN|nr:hypothetical protein VIGAN_10232400 [Vigna angularis var. angularis]